MINIWKKSSLTTNPYRETAFQALGITRDVVSRAEIGRQIEERRQAIKNVPGYFLLNSRPLTQTDITNAREILFNPTRRILEELLEHKPEHPQVEEIERLRERLPKPDWPQEIPMPVRLAFLVPVILDFARQYLENLPPLEVPPFPIDLTFIPPFGILREVAGTEVIITVIGR